MSTTSSSAARRFLAIVAVIAPGLWLLAAAAAFWLDPLAIHGDSAAQAICAPGRAWKGFAFVRSQSRAAIVGSSRVGIGVDPTDLPARAFNLGLDGANVRETVDLAIQLMDGGYVDRILFGIDEDGFFAAGSGQAFAIEGGSLAAALAYLRRETLRSAWSAWNRRGVCAFPQRPGDGLIYADNPLATLSDGDLEFWANRLARQCLGRDCAGAYRESLASLARLVQVAARRQTRLTLFLNPVHSAHRQLQIRVIGPDREEQWRRDVAAIAASMSEPVRDFTQYDAEDAGARASDEISGFVDYSHFSAATGRDMLRIIETGAPRGAYGAALTPQAVEGLNAHVRAAHEAWVRSHPAEVARIERAATRVRPSAPGK